MPAKKSLVVNDQYAKFANVWSKMRDSLESEEHMKNRSLQQNTGNLDGRAELKAITTFTQYLRPTDSMRRLGELGYQRFCDYIYRAKYYPFPAELRSQSLGLIENEPAVFDLPPRMEFMREDATTDKESLAKVMSIINTEQLEVARVGLLLNPSNDAEKPFNVGTYHAETILDWNEIVLANSETTLDWIKIQTDECDSEGNVIYLILALDAERTVYFQYKTTNDKTQYGEGFAEDDKYIVDSYIEPKAAESTLDQIPFVIINVIKLGSDIERPFLESVTDAAVSLFRASAHHEDALFWGGESSLFTKGYGLDEKDDTIYVGNGASNKSNADYADAKYVTMGTDGIEPRASNTKALFEYCVSLGVDLLNKGTESGAALNIRSNVKTASLKTLALTGALGLQTLLRIGAKWLSLDVDAVIVTANTTFADVRYTAEDFEKFSLMVNVGAMRATDLYQLQKKHDITTAENFEDWEKDLKNSEPANNSE